MWNTDYDRDCFNAYHRLNLGLLFKLDVYIMTWTFPEEVSLITCIEQKILETETHWTVS